MRLVIVGGVAGGMSCAARARRLDESCEIVVLERGEHVSFANCGLPYYVGGEISDADSLLARTPEALRQNSNLDVRVHHEVTGLDVEDRSVSVQGPDGSTTIGYDALVLSPGAYAVRPPISGLDSARVRTLRTVEDAVTLRNMVESGARQAVVLGAGFIGLEAAEAFVLAGLGVTVVEMASQVGPPLETEIAGPTAAELRRLGIDLRLGVSADAVESAADHDEVVLSDGTRVAADVIVLSVGVRPDTAVFESAGVVCDHGAIVVDDHGRTSVPDIWAVGDAVASVHAVTGARRPVALAGPANRGGRLIADAILSPETARAIPTAVGTAIVRVGELAVAMTGANRAALDDAGIPYRSVHLHARHHAGYFPGATGISLIVHVGTDDGRVLGAQAIGANGVDKRIDVLATAIRSGMSAGDLIDLDLAYSPPYGSARDVVNLAGMVATDVLEGSLELWYADQFDQVAGTSLLLDVRAESDFARGTLRGAINVPADQVRHRLDEIAAAAQDRPIRLLCANGTRAAAAHRILTQFGFDSAALSGGLMTLRAVLGDHFDAVFVEPEAVGGT